MQQTSQSPIPRIIKRKATDDSEDESIDTKDSQQLLSDRDNEFLLTIQRMIRYEVHTKMQKMAEDIAQVLDFGMERQMSIVENQFLAPMQDLVDELQETIQSSLKGLSSSTKEKNVEPKPLVPTNTDNTSFESLQTEKRRIRYPEISVSNLRIHPCRHNMQYSSPFV